MRIMVCIKQILDIRLPVEVNRKGNLVGIKNNGPLYIMNPTDINALEAAIIINKFFKKGEVIAVTFGDQHTEKALQYCLARGADSAWRIWDDGLDPDDPYLTSLVLYKAVKIYNFDLVVCGVISADTNLGLVPALLAERLDWPWVNQVVDVQFNESGEIIDALKRAEKGSRIEIKVRLPAVLSIDENSFLPKYVSANRIKLAQSKVIKRYSPSDLSLTNEEINENRSTCRVVRTRFPKPRIKRTAFLSQNVSGEELMWQMISGSSSKREGNQIINGHPSEQAEKILEFLKEKGVLA